MRVRAYVTCSGMHYLCKQPVYVRECICCANAHERFTICTRIACVVCAYAVQNVYVNALCPDSLRMYEHMLCMYSGKPYLCTDSTSTCISVCVFVCVYGGGCVAVLRRGVRTEGRGPAQRKGCSSPCFILGVTGFSRSPGRDWAGEGGRGG